MGNILADTYRQPDGRRLGFRLAPAKEPNDVLRCWRFVSDRRVEEKAKVVPSRRSTLVEALTQQNPPEDKDHQYSEDC